MIRTFFAANLFVGTLFVIAMSGALGQQPAKGKFDPPASMKPDEATLKVIAEKTEQLRKALALMEKNPGWGVRADIELYLKAAENIVRFDEWYAKDSGKWALTTLDRGLERAKVVSDSKGRPKANELGDVYWQRTTGKWIVRGYTSRIDDSIQPYAVVYPDNYGQDQEKTWPLDVILHGRDSSLTEAKFIATHDGKPGPKGLDRILLEVYGRGNNAYRWAGETDVFEAIHAAGHRATGTMFGTNIIDDKRIVLRGFSMGGAGTWHLGLHHPDQFCVIGPGAGFTNTRGYINGLPAKLPDYQEKCLHIYDAVDYAENAFNVPIVAYSGEKDPQKAAADNIEKLLKGFKEPFRFTHLIAPGLEHQMPAEWQAKAEAEYKKFRDTGRKEKPERVRFVTYTLKYAECDWVRIEALDKSYEKTVIDASRKKDAFVISTTNVREFHIDNIDLDEGAFKFVVDGQNIIVPNRGGWPRFEKKNGKWKLVTDPAAHWERLEKHPEKRQHRSGPIDDAFTSYFWVVNPSKPGWFETTDKHAKASLGDFGRLWDRYFRSKLPVGPVVPERGTPGGPERPSEVLFGDPESNPEIAKILPKLPITWTKDKLMVNGVEYDPRAHLPVMIYPHPKYGDRYVVINSGHTFKEADLKGTNALLYPRLGDWAVIKPTPTAKDPAAYEVVAAGLFDENWQFPKK